MSLKHVRKDQTSIITENTDVWILHYIIRTYSHTSLRLICPIVLLDHYLPFPLLPFSLLSSCFHQQQYIAGQCIIATIICVTVTACRLITVINCISVQALNQTSLSITHTPDLCTRSPAQTYLLPHYSRWISFLCFFYPSRAWWAHLFLDILSPKVDHVTNNTLYDLDLMTYCNVDVLIRIKYQVSKSYLFYPY